MKNLFSFLTVLVAIFMLASVVTAKSHSGRDDSSKFNDRDKVKWSIEKVRDATEKYKNVNRAIKDGYAPTDFFVPNMGFHYVKEKLVDGKVNALTPEVLLYVPTKKGLKLVGVEYLSTDVRSSLFGRTFDPANTEAGIPPSLHAWIWERNPDGMFTPFNPKIGNGPGGETGTHQGH
ncbi:hypothetical protein [Neobacillus niacini]|uniref:hypothetical protein n=1 Tax=Neobacillus niacini TaxID=86668 RepID=UPI0039831AE3